MTVVWWWSRVTFLNAADCVKNLSAPITEESKPHRTVIIHISSSGLVSRVARHELSSPSVIREGHRYWTWHVGVDVMYQSTMMSAKDKCGSNRANKSPDFYRFDARESFPLGSPHLSRLQDFSVCTTCDNLATGLIIGPDAELCTKASSCAGIIVASEHDDEAGPPRSAPLLRPRINPAVT